MSERQPLDSRSTWGDLTVALAAEGYIDAAGIERVGAALSERTEEAPAPWYVVALVSASAWIASLLILFFLIAVDWVDEGPEFLVAGLVLMAVAVLLGHVGRPMFLQQLGVALGLAGQACAAVGVYQIWENPEWTWASLAGVAALLFFIHPSPIHRLLSVLVAVFGLAALIAASEQHALLHVLVLGMALGAVYLWEHESPLAARGVARLAQPLALGLTLGLPALLFVAQIEPIYTVQRIWVSSAGLAIGLLYVVRRVAPRPALGFAVLFAFFAFDHPGLIASLLLTMLAYGRGKRALAAFLLAAFVAQVGYIVYEIDMNLLDRSLLLMGSGLVLLAMRGVLRLYRAPETDEEATP
ncbi:MAG: DUF4401 domain-containing protein [Rhodothermales bacterium]